MTRRRHQTTQHSGFTLIELMVVLAILGLLATFSWNSYQQHVTRSRRAEGRAAVLQVLLQQERHHARDHSYRTFTPADTDAGTEFRRFSGDLEATSAYQIAAAACPDADLLTCVQVTATPRPGVFTDPQCGALSADTLGRRQPPGNGCW
ncbi:type IV pilin protein [Herbaspirillum sp. alder98]|uniref:type IV pilin protein n=1 Tax=Herbaspirillum sp. alder98 TaxID=2913096 RepID=UPI001CD87446|nr:type IV pilin protein [Herbaspirillum sp. alder98]